MNAPPDVLANGCPWCGGPPLFVHETDHGSPARFCDRCGTEWPADELRRLLVGLMLGGLGIKEVGDNG